ncbi:MAG: AmmeMemoRadiSam system radical SAM enzyme [Candidatus Burarchaeum sp.]|nr:AmmeMemoRadiSam system radical SAM enzyme [Candidatus Burarchaeum sp.]MDO8340086.1 AmmeMemoRadiSam system radical SAM enzyme [Candidatus Burarchaeum sp.]
MADEAAVPKEAMLYEKLTGQNSGKVLCRLCMRYCIIGEGERGYCLVRRNVEGKLYSLNYGKSSGFEIDPIEKKPFFHFKPGTQVLSFGTPGCNFRCLNCQNWMLSQGVREAGPTALDIPSTLPKKVVEMAVDERCDGIAYTYSEPTIFFEYAHDCVKEARARAPNLFQVFVSNGYFSREMLDLVVKEKILDAIRIDLKFIDDKKYEEVTGGHLLPVQQNIKRVYGLKGKIHLEVIALIIPTLNDSEDDLRRLCEFVAGVGKDIPLHINAFYPQYKLSNLPPTPEKTLLRAGKIAKEAGLEYVYLGNARIPHAEDTICPQCGEVLIERSGFLVLKNKFKGKKPECTKCGKKINIVL